ncbi:hypothetical protein EDEG_03784 [Edhazardia aedis USNM 41457]|uniref:Uncharacterized protein n=1 Tax=Edhazardia aedis (strain USNM 41457) TaxID=1003232 RepID=J9DJZ3_EDHAE|nr:hypothetical protein EDEG_03784 [Edhazardia aedis USNM 41457]|eukprot:EJW01672.1 hypothetical protein EDEG_03784 [Edhazardia aedis USNM 41457]
MLNQWIKYLLKKSLLVLCMGMPIFILLYYFSWYLFRNFRRRYRRKIEEMLSIPPNKIKCYSKYIQKNIDLQKEILDKKYKIDGKDDHLGTDKTSIYVVYIRDLKIDLWKRALTKMCENSEDIMGIKNFSIKQEYFTHLSNEILCIICGNLNKNECFIRADKHMKIFKCIYEFINMKISYYFKEYNLSYDQQNDAYQLLNEMQISIKNYKNKNINILHEEDHTLNFYSPKIRKINIELLNDLEIFVIKYFKLQERIKI